MIIITITTIESSSISSTHRNVAELFVPMPEAGGCRVWGLNGVSCDKQRQNGKQKR